MSNFQLPQIKELLFFYLLITILVLSIYFLGQDITRFFLVIGLVVFWISKKDYFWFSLVFLILLEPGTLLSADTLDKSTTLPTFKLGFINLLFIDLFLIIAVIKAQFIGRKKNIFLSQSWLILFIYLGLRFSASIFIDESSSYIFDFLRLFLGFSLLFSIPRLFPRIDSFIGFVYLLLPSVFFILISQFYTIVSGKFLLSVFTVGNVENFYRASGIKGIEIFLFIYFSLIMLELVTKPTIRRYFYLILILSVVSIFLSATKSWIIIFIIFGISYYLAVVKSVPQMIFNTLIIFATFGILYSFVPEFRTGFDLVFERFLDFKYFAEGDLNTESGGRILNRVPVVLSAFYSSPFFGIGFSDGFVSLLDSKNVSTLGDYHVGNLNLVANIGIVGFLLFTVLWFNYFRIILVLLRSNVVSERDRRISILLIVTFICILILHMTSYQLFGFTTHIRITFFIAFFFSFSGELIKYIEHGKKKFGQ